MTGMKMQSTLSGTGTEPMAGAIFDSGEVYRYALWRTWDTNKPSMMFLLLNPSTATAEIMDPTMTRCMGFAMRWGYGKMVVANIFALRSTDPKMLYLHSDPIGPDNNKHIVEMVQKANRVVVGWGNHGTFKSRGKAVLKLISPHTDIYCFGLTEKKQPRHPLYLPNNADLIKIGEKEKKDI